MFYNRCCNCSGKTYYFQEAIKNRPNFAEPYLSKGNVYKVSLYEYYQVAIHAWARFWRETKTFILSSLGNGDDPRGNYMLSTCYSYSA